MSKLIPIIYMIGVLLLVLPSFIKSNNNLKTFLTNLSIWVALLLVLFSLYYVFKLLIYYILFYITIKHLNNLQISFHSKPEATQHHLFQINLG